MKDSSVKEKIISQALCILEKGERMYFSDVYIKKECSKLQFVPVLLVCKKCIEINEKCSSFIVFDNNFHCCSLVESDFQIFITVDNIDYKSRLAYSPSSLHPHSTLIDLKMMTVDGLRFHWRNESVLCEKNSGHLSDTITCNQLPVYQEQIELNLKLNV